MTPELNDLKKKHYFYLCSQGSRLARSFLASAELTCMSAGQLAVSYWLMALVGTTGPLPRISHVHVSDLDMFSG